VSCVLPTGQIEQDVIIHCTCGGGTGFFLFEKLTPKENIRAHCREKHALFGGEPYLAIHVRNTDIKSDYVTMYENNKELINSYPKLYVATDDKDVVTFFQSKNLCVVNFTTFPEWGQKSYNLHTSLIDPDKKIKDVMCDFYMMLMAHEFVSCSNGGFIQLIIECRKNIEAVKTKFS
jgi:hypothetical protein